MVRNLDRSLELGGKCLLSWLDPAHYLLPTGGWLVSHDVGRWWDAMLRLEDETGFEIPGDLEQAMLANFDRCTSNPDGLLLIPAGGIAGIKPTFELHSLREGFLGAAALVRHRGSDWAAERGHVMAETVQRALRQDSMWDFSAFSYLEYASLPRPDGRASEHGGDLTGSSGRAIEAMLCFYEATGDSLVLDLAERLAEDHLHRTTLADGSIPAHITDPDNPGHSHSYLNTLRGLLRFGLSRGREDIVERISRTYRGAVAEVVRGSGYAPHDLGKHRFDDPTGNPVGECASTGDAAQIALWLAREAGQTDLYDDVQRLVVSRLLPAQITPEDAHRERGRDLRPRMMGGWGVHGAPHGRKGSILDVVAAVVHSLVDIRKRSVSRTGETVAVHLHLSVSTRLADVEVRRGEGVEVRVTPHVRGPVEIRVPRWVDPSTLRFEVDGSDVEPRIRDSHLLAPDGVMHLSLKYGMPQRESVEVMPNGDRYRFTWAGDEISGVTPNDVELPFYPDG